MNDEHILRIKEKFESDESIRRYEYHEYLPITGTNLDKAGEIRIILESQDEIFHPASSLLIISGRLKKSDNSDYGATDNAALINNAPMYLFNNIRYELSGHEIESINNPGPATTMKGLLKYSDDFERGEGMNQCWRTDTDDTASITTNEGAKARHAYVTSTPVTASAGTFSFAIPFKHIFGFAEDYDKILYGFRHVLTMVRQADGEAIFRDTAAGEGKIVLSKIAWFMPRVLLNDQEKLGLMKTVESKALITAGFRVHHCDTITVNQGTTFSWRMSVKSTPECPRWVIVGFQTDKTGSQEKNPALFDHCTAKNVWVELNGHAYPEVQRNTDFSKNEIATLYHAISEFLPNYYGLVNAQPNISPQNFKSLYPLHVIDVSKQPERVKYGVIDMNLKATFVTAVAASTQAYALIISDRIINFQSDGSKMNVTY